MILLVFSSLCSCAGSASAYVDFCKVVIEDGTDYAAEERVKTIGRKSDVVFHIRLYNGCMIESVDYPDYDLEQEDAYAVLTLHEVKYSVVISIFTTYEYVFYEANGGVRTDGGEGTSVKKPVYAGHLRMNTARGTELFTRSGYVLTGWNTEANGTGEHVGLGSRIEKENGLTLYAEWSECSSVRNFEYYAADGMIYITNYRGAETVCTVPEEIDGLPVRKLNAYAFAGSCCEKVILPPTILSVERYAFSGARLKELYLFDNIVSIYDESFFACDGLTTLHINAAVKPVYSGTYFDTFSDKFDYLLQIGAQKKLVLFSGSSARFGYDSVKLKEAFPDYEVVNMGVYAYTNALPQLEIIRTCMREGDILLDAPEFDAVAAQFCVTDELDRVIFNLVESDYDAFTLLDLRRFSKVFGSFNEYLSIKSSMETREYSVSAKDYDEDGNPVSNRTYNQYGDFIFPRPNGEKDEMLKYIRADYTIASFPAEVIDSINRAFSNFSGSGVRVYFSYAPRNRSSLTAESTLEARKTLHRYLRESLCVPVISELEDYLYAGIYFYEIDNHLSTEGVQIRTEKIIEDLKRQMQKDGLL